MKPQKLYKTVIIIWCEKPPPQPESEDIGVLGDDVETGKTYCSNISVEEITDQTMFPKTDYFNIPTND